MASYFAWQLIMTAGSGGLNDIGKFEFKMAKSIEQRLDDVKGIDEIKDEIVNIIRIIKNPQLY